MSGKRVWVVGTDIGGTFTDVIGVNLETGEQRIGKVASTPPTFFDGVINGLARAGLRGEETLSFRHGATVSTNAILERKGVKTALITTEGFRDVLGGGRAERISAFELDWDPPELIVPRRNVLVVRERVSPYGEIVTPLEEADVERAARMIRKRGIESVAVVYIDSFINPVHELRTREILRQELPDIDITLSYEVLPQMLEFERTCTTVLNAYVSPILKNYLQGLADRLKTDWGYDGAILVTTSGGGVIGMDEALKLPARTFHSSPVSGAVGLAGYIGSLAGFENVIAFETGGTTNNVSIIYRGKPAITHEWKILWNVPCCLPSVDTVYIGAGGGSIGWVDKGGILNVGPQSMGAVPGPACYGAGGTEPTNTDTQIILGRIDPNYYLGGEIQVELEAVAKRARGQDRSPSRLGCRNIRRKHVHGRDDEFDDGNAPANGQSRLGPARFRHRSIRRRRCDVCLRSCSRDRRLNGHRAAIAGLCIRLRCHPCRCQARIHDTVAQDRDRTRLRQTQCRIRRSGGQGA